jgi:hypothetical protein
MNWKLYIDSPEKRALDLCVGSMEEGNGYGYGRVNGRGDGYGRGNGRGDGDGYDYGRGCGYGDGRGGGSSASEWR